jgi:hypothetical protein
MPKTGDQIDTAIKPLFERHNEALKVLGTGNGAGTLASVAALHTFSDQAVILPIVKIAAGFFAGGVILFAIAYLAFTTAHIFIQDYTVKLDRYGTSPVTMKAHDAAMGGLYVAAATAYLSAACFFIGIGAGFIALIRTSSARASRIGGTSRPSAFAVLRLTEETSSLETQSASQFGRARHSGVRT